MGFDIHATLNDMLEAVRKVVGDSWDDVGEYATQVFTDHAETLEELARMRLRNEITHAELKSELEDEKTTLEAELRAMQVLGKAVAQKAANAAIRAFIKAVKSALPL